ncbi:hypothetical protein KR215_007863 [Drosophila sulfurigaster]|nr:hypothetical protein KR215_007863 [Drosophila sulfurigaster]
MHLGGIVFGPIQRCGGLFRYSDNGLYINDNNKPEYIIHNRIVNHIKETFVASHQRSAKEAQQLQESSHFIEKPSRESELQQQQQRPQQPQHLEEPALRLNNSKQQLQHEYHKTN